MPTELSHKRALIVGVGGLGCPASWILAEAGVELWLADDDRVDESNLHRQVLFSDRDLGAPKTQAAARRLRELLPPELRPRPAHVRALGERLLPHNARELCRSVDIVVEGADNYATKFLAADAALLEARPIVHGAAIGWRGTAWAVSPAGTPCYRCVFEDLPTGRAASCESAGVIGPVTGFIGALLAELALAALRGKAPWRRLHSYDGKTDALRTLSPERRLSCPACGPTPSIVEIDERRYTRESIPPYPRTNPGASP